MKLLLGKISVTKLGKNCSLTRESKNIISKVTDTWKENNQAIDVHIAEDQDEAVEIMERVHQNKNNESGMDPLSTIQWARFERDYKNAKDGYLELVEKFLESNFLHRKVKEGFDIEKYEDDFPFSLFKDEAFPIYLRKVELNIDELNFIYPYNIDDCTKFSLEKYVFDIGTGTVSYRGVREKNFFEEILEKKYDIKKIDIDVLFTSKDEEKAVPSIEPEEENNDIDTSEEDQKKHTKIEPSYKKNIKKLIELSKDKNIPKLESSLSELLKILNSTQNRKNYTIACTMLIRMCIELSARHYAKIKGIGYQKHTLDSILKNIYNSKQVNNAEIYNILADIQSRNNSSIKSLNIIVHHLESIPVPSELETHFNNIYGMCVYFLDN